MADEDTDTLIRMTAFDRVRRLGEMHDHLTAATLQEGPCDCWRYVDVDRD